MTPEQINKIRLAAGSLPLGASGQSPQPSAQPLSVRLGFKTQVQEAPKVEEPSNSGFIPSLVKGAIVDPYKALVERPAVKFGQALAAPIVYGFGDEETINRYNQETQKPTKAPLGMTIEGQKTGVSGAKQIAGEGLEAATNIAGLAIGGSAGKTALTAPNTFVKGAIAGAKAGAATGGLYGGGLGTAKALQEDKSAGEIVTAGITGGVVGAGTGAITGGLIGGTTGAIRGYNQRQLAIKEGLAANRQPTDVIEYSKDPVTGKVKIDPIAKKAIDQGIDPVDVQFIKNASPEDKGAFREMYKIAESASTDKTVTRQPVEVAGKSLVNQVKYLDTVRRDVGNQLGKVAKAMPQQPVDITPVVNRFVENLDDAGIAIGDKGMLNFDSSRYADQPAVQKQLQQAYSAISKGKLNPSSIISTRQRIFTNRNYGKAANEIIPGDNVDRIIGELYDTLDEPLKSLNPAYAELAQKYAQTSNVIREFGSSIGKNFDLSDELTNLRAGEVGQRILGNASAKPLALIQNISDTAKGLGYKGTENIRDQFLFSSMLQDPKLDVFKPTQTSSLRGQVARGAMDVVKDFKGGFVSGVSNLAEKGLKSAEGVNTESKRQALQGLIGLGDKTLPTSSMINPSVSSSAVSNLSKQNQILAAQIKNSELLSGPGSKYVGSVEQATEQAGGWIEGLREVFDRALNNKNKMAVKALLPSVPEEYKTRFAKDIAKLLKS